VTDTYDIAALELALASQQTSLVYLPETASTMDIGFEQGLRKSVVLTDHQTAGRGRYSRQWDDDSRKSILATFVRSIPRSFLPPSGSLLLSHLFVLAVRQAIGDAEVMIKWPNDLMIGDKKLGGVLLSEGQRVDDKQAILFGVGVNVFHIGEDDRASLDMVSEHPDRALLITSINHTLDTYLADLPRLTTPEVYHHYQTLWHQAAGLIGAIIHIEGYGEASDQQLSGRVIDSFLGKPLSVRLDDGGIIELRDYGHKAHITTIERQTS